MVTTLPRLIIVSVTSVALLSGADSDPHRPEVGTVRGAVHFNGAPPTPSRPDMSTDPWCLANAGPAESPVNRDGTVPQVLVFVVDGPATPRGGDTPVLDQSGCRYRPGVIGVMTGQEFIIRNSDETMHNVHVTPLENRGFNIGQPFKGLESRRTFDVPDYAIDVKCDIHGWMSGAIFVFNHRHFVLTDTDGRFMLPDLPVGTWTIRAWHPTLGALDREVTITGTGPLDLTFTFQP